MNLNRLLKNLYGRGFISQTIWGITLAFITAGAQYTMTQHLGVMIDSVQSRPEEIHYHFSLITTFLLCYLAGNAAFTFFSGKTAASFSCRLQSKIGDKLCSARYQVIEQTEDGEVLTLADKDIESLKNWFMLLWRTGTLPVNLLLIPISLFRLCNWKFTLSVLCMIPLNAIVSVMIAKRLPLYYHNEKSAYANAISAFTSTIQFEMMIKAFRLEQVFQEKTKAALKEHLKRKKERLAYERLAEVFNRCFGHFSRIILLLIGAYLIFTEDMTLGGLTSIILLAELVGEGLKIIGSIPACLQSARVGASRLEKLLTMEDEDQIQIENAANTQGKNEVKTLMSEENETKALMRKQNETKALMQEKDASKAPMSESDKAHSGIPDETPPQEEPPVYRVERLSFSYANTPILRELSFQIKEGEKIAIVGPSGGGKTTLFKLLSGLYLPEKNRIFFRGKDLTGISLQELRNNITVTPQEAFLFQASLKDNVKVAKPRAAHEEIIEACRKARIDAFIQSLEYGYNTKANTTVQTISNGQMQRINLARAFLRDSKVILLDEPTSALDADTEDLIWNDLFTGCAGKTMLVILHDLKEITRFDKILVLSQGTMAGFGTHEELLRDCRLYERLYQKSGKKNRSVYGRSDDSVAGI